MMHIEIMYSFVTNEIRQMILQGRADSSDLSNLHNRNSTISRKIHSEATFTTLNQLNTSEIRRRLETYTKFMFVRHPLKRFISAYRSKFQKIDRDSERFRRTYGREIVARFRGNKSSVPPGAPINDVTFKEFADLVVLPRTYVHDKHWRPMTDLCLPCAVGYDFVGRHENLEAGDRACPRRAPSRAADRAPEPRRRRTPPTSCTT